MSAATARTGPEEKSREEEVIGISRPHGMTTYTVGVQRYGETYDRGPPLTPEPPATGGYKEGP